MEISRKMFCAIIVLAVVASCTVTYAVQRQLVLYSLHKNPTLRANVFLIYEKFGANAKLEQGNVITNKGEILTRDAFALGWDQNVTKLAVGNASGTLQTKTVLDDVYNDPTDGQYPTGTVARWSNGGDAAYNCTFKWTFEETVTLDAAAIYTWNTTWAYAIANFPSGSQTFNNGENLTVRWVITFDAND